MDGLRNPVGDEPPRTYWKRRLVVGLVAIIVLVLLIFGLSSLFGGADSDAPPATTSDSTASTSPAADSNGSGDSASRACAPADVTITTVANPAGVPAGDPVKFDVSLAQTGSGPCMIDTAAEGTELLITSGSDRIYSSTDCPEDAAIAGTQLIMEPGANEMVAATWNGKRSAPKCAAVTAEPGAGTYNASVTIQGIPSEPAVFQLQ